MGADLARPRDAVDGIDKTLAKAMEKSGDAFALRTAGQQ